MSTCQELRYRKLWNTAIDKQPAFIATKVFELQRTETTCPFCGTDPTGESNLFLDILKARIILCHLDGLWNKVGAFEQVCHDALILQRDTEQFAAHENRARIATILLVIVTPFYNLAFRLHKRIINMLLCYQFLYPWEIVGISATRTHIVFVQQPFHKEAHSFFVHIYAYQVIVRVVLTDDTCY